MAPSLGQLDVVGVCLKYPDSPSADPLHRSVHVSALGQTRNLGGWSSHAAHHDARLYAWGDIYVWLLVQLQQGFPGTLSTCQALNMSK